MNILDEILAELRELRREHAQLRDALASATPAPAEQEHLDVEGAARVLLLSVHTVRKMCAERKLPHYSKGENTKLYFRRSELIAYMEQGKRETATKNALTIMRGNGRSRRAS